MTGPPKSFAVTSGGTATTTKTISGITITEKVTDAFGVRPQRRQHVLHRLATPAGVTFGASPSLSVTGSGISTDLLQSIVTTGVGPLGTANSRITITISNAPAPGVLSSFTLNNVQLIIPRRDVGTVRAILTDCGDGVGPGGSLNGQLGTGDADGGALATGTDPAPPAVNTTAVSANTFTGIGNFSGPNDSVNDLNRVVLFFLLLADRSGGNDRVATARILQQEKYGLVGRQSHFCRYRWLHGHESARSSRRRPSSAVARGSRSSPRQTTSPTRSRPRTPLVASVRRSCWFARRLTRWPRSSSPSRTLVSSTVLVLGGPAAVPDTVVDFIKGLPTSCTTSTQCGGVSNNFTNGDPRQVPGTKLTVARIQDPINDTRYGTMRLLNILTGLPVSIPVVVQQPTPASVQRHQAGGSGVAGQRVRHSAAPPSWCPVRTSPTLCRRVSVRTPRASR